MIFVCMCCTQTNVAEINTSKNDNVSVFGDFNTSSCVHLDRFLWMEGHHIWSQSMTYLFSPSPSLCSPHKPRSWSWETNWNLIGPLWLLLSSYPAHRWILMFQKKQRSHRAPNEAFFSAKAVQLKVWEGQYKVLEGIYIRIYTSLWEWAAANFVGANRRQQF